MLYYSCPTVVHVFEDENVRLALRKVRRRVLEQRMSLFAVLDNNDLKHEIMGLELHLVTSHEEPPIQVCIRTTNFPKALRLEMFIK